MKNITRLVQLAFALEALPNKPGCTTRLVNKEESLKLEYFIISAINFGSIVDSLNYRTMDFPTTSYDLLLQATIESMDHRGGRRVNAGMLQIVWPILLLLLTKGDKFSNIKSALSKCSSMLLDTNSQDAYYAQIAQNFSFSFWDGHNKHIRPIKEFPNVFSYYEFLASQTIPGHHKLFCHELTHKFPILSYMNEVYNRSKTYDEAMIEVFNMTRQEFKGTSVGLVADLCACLTLLLFYYEDYKIL